MKREICRINMTVTDDGENTAAEGHITFRGNNDDMTATIAHFFTALELEPVQALLLSTEAISLMREGEAEE